MNYQHIIVQQEGPVTVITFNRPEIKNCIGTRMHRELVHAFDRFRTDASAKAAIVRDAR